jgi:hypothetical protein
MIDHERYLMPFHLQRRGIMHEQAIAIYLICDELIKVYGITDDPQCKMTTAEVITFALLSALHYGADYRKTRLVAVSCRYFTNILSNSRMVRRIHQVPKAIWMIVFKVLQMFLIQSENDHFIVDSFPVKAYENHKSFRARIFKGKEFHGYIASKKQYFFGIKVHMIVDGAGIPIEFCFMPGSASDISGLKHLPCELPAGSTLLGDKAYTDYQLEDDLLSMAKIRLAPKRKANQKRQHSRSMEYILNSVRNGIETAFSSIISRMPRHIRARTEEGFYLKILLFIVAYLIHLSTSQH